MKLVIFDLDDTLVDFASTRKVAHGCMAQVLVREGFDAQAYLRACVTTAMLVLGVSGSCVLLLLLVGQAWLIHSLKLAPANLALAAPQKGAGAAATSVGAAPSGSPPA